MDQLTTIELFLNKLPRKVNISELLEIIDLHHIPAQMVTFVPLFSIKSPNDLIEKISIADNQIYIYIYIAKIPIFSKLIDYYEAAENNDQQNIADLITDTTSIFLHDYFYGLYPGYNQKYSEYYYRGHGIYGEHDTVVFSATILINTLQNLLSDFTCFSSLRWQYVQTKANGAHLGANSILNDTYLAGSKALLKPSLTIRIILDTLNQQTIGKIQKHIKDNLYYQMSRKHVSLKLIMMSSESRIQSFLPNVLGKCMINGYSEITL
tara:strand:+ start:6519 stop:7313 length:795 start_codon:yes stop_codon:yes gene_type:complete